MSQSRHERIPAWRCQRERAGARCLVLRKGSRRCKTAKAAARGAGRRGRSSPNLCGPPRPHQASVASCNPRTDCMHAVKALYFHCDRLVRGSRDGSAVPWWTGWSIPQIPSEIRAVAPRKLDVLDAAVQLDELTRPPGNRLEALAGDLVGFHSIRINQQWRLIFRWLNGDAHDVAIVDYH